jgi:hypothetical protein
METKQPIPKTQKEILDDNLVPYIYPKVSSSANRSEQIRRDNDNVKDYSVGLEDIDEAIVFYFKDVIKPFVIQNGNQINVPLIYGSPERWKSAQEDGYYRDKENKLQVPLIMFKRNNIEKQRNLGNKLDANNPLNFQIFEKKYSSKNNYDNFSVLSNRKPTTELYGVIIPDYVAVTYEFIIWSEYIEQMNKLVESVNYASDSYWGDPERFQFRAKIDSITPTNEVNNGEERYVKSNFNLTLNGYIIPDTINKQIASHKISKVFTKTTISFTSEINTTDLF